MSRIFLVRHGQASFGRANYDELSDLGWIQGRACGEALRRQGIQPAVVVSGTLQRQRSTAEAISDGSHWQSALDVDERWNELDPDALLSSYRPDLAEKSALTAELAQHDDPHRAFQALYAEACQRWVRGDTDGAEPFSAFSHRVLSALGSVVDRLGRGDDALVVTSGGPIALIASALLTQEPSGDPHRLVVSTDAPVGMPQAWLNLSKIVVNASVSTVLAGRNWTLLDFNSHEHLATDQEIVTFR